MDINLVRVDCRLIHGQILEVWLPSTNADTLVVVNDEVAGDDLKRKIMQMAVPHTVEVRFLTVSETASELHGGFWENKHVIVLLANCQDALKLFSAGLKYDQLNLGNQHFSPDKKQITFTLCLNDSDVDCLRKLDENGVTIEARSAPTDPIKNFTEILKLSQI